MAGEGVDHITCLLCHRQFQAIGWSHLVCVHEFDPEHPILEYERCFGLKRTRCTRFFQKLKHALHAHFERLGTRWTRERIKHEIRQLKDGGRPLSSAALTRGGRGNLVQAGWRLYGSWKKAISASGMDYERIRAIRSWFREKVVAKLKELRLAGAKLHRAAMRDLDSRLLDAAVRHFGSWDGALRAAGVDPACVRRQRPPWTRPRVIAQIRKLPRPVVRSHVLRRVDSGLLWGARKVFGTWEAAVKAAGLKYPKRTWRRKWSPEKVQGTIRERAGKGLSLLKTATANEAGGLVGAACRLFGTWRRAVETAGFRYPPRLARKWPPDRILGTLRARARTGKSFRPSRVRGEARGLLQAGRRRFGSWQAALRAAGVPYRGRAPREPRTEGSCRERRTPVRQERPS